MSLCNHYLGDFQTLIGLLSNLHYNYYNEYRIALTGLWHCKVQIQMSCYSGYQIINKNFIHIFYLEMSECYNIKNMIQIINMMCD